MTAALRRPPAERRTFGPAWHRRVNGLHVLSLCGSVREMARQHGALLKEEIPRGPVPYYRTYIEKILRTSGLGPLAGPSASLIRRLVGRRVAEAMPEFGRDALSGLAAGAELAEEELLDGCTMPDSLLWGASRLMQARGVPRAMAHRMSLGLGCTSAIAWGSATRDGALLHARNFDYHGVEAWPRTAAVAFHRPDEGQRYVSVTAAGIPLGGVTAMNEAGLSLTVHQHMFTDGTVLGGTPIGLVGDLIMRRAADLDTAQAILERHRPIGCWTYLVTDGRRREVLCYEENPKRRAPRRAGGEPGTFGYANIYLDPELGATERDLYGSYWRHNLGRHRRVGELLAAGAGGLDPSGMAAILADTGGTDCRIHRAIAMMMTVASVVFRPEDGVLWVATGGAPTSHNRYEPFDLAAGDHAPERGALEPEVPGGPEAASAFACYRDAYIAYFERGDLAGARALLDRARELQPRQPLYPVVSGLVALKSGDAAGAFDALGRALDLAHPDPERRAAAALWRGRAADLEGRREEALALYRTALAGPSDPPVARAARRGLRRRYTRRRASQIDIDFAYADVLSP